MTDRTYKIIYWVLTGLVAFIFTGSAIVKLTGGQQTLEMAKGVGGTSNLTILGVLELIIVSLWLLPRTGVVGTFFAVAYIGGAIAVHFVNNQSTLAPIIIQSLIWITAIYRFPEIKKRLFNQI